MDSDKMTLYERMDGTIVEVYGFVDDKCMFKYIDAHGKRIASSCPRQEMDSWKIRRDLNDLPGARDARLPYEFDLNHDLKYVSDLKRELAHGDEDKELSRLVKKYNIKL